MTKEHKQKLEDALANVEAAQNRLKNSTDICNQAYKDYNAAKEKYTDIKDAKIVGAVHDKAMRWYSINETNQQKLKAETSVLKSILEELDLTNQ